MQETLGARRFRRAMEGCWLLVFAVAPVLFSRSVTNTFVYDKIPFFRALVEMGLLTALLGGLLAGLRPARRPALSGAVAGYTVILLLATLGAWSPANSWWGYYPLLFGTFTLLHGVALFALMACYMTAPVQRSRWLAAVLIAAAVVCIYAIIQRTGHDPYQWYGPTKTTDRPSSTIGNASRLAGYLVFVMPLTLGALLSLRSRVGRLVLAVLLLLELTTLVFTFTRGAWLGTAALLGCFALLLGWRRGHVRLVRMTLAIGTLCIVGVLVVNARPQLVAHSGNAYLRRLADLKEDWPGSSGWERLQMWQIALHAARGPALWLGYGPESFIHVGSREFRPRRSDYAEQGQVLESTHNIFLDALVHTGLLGVGALLALLGSGFVLGLRALKRVTSPADECLLIAALSGLVGYVIQGVFFFDHLMTLLFVMGLLAVIVSIAQPVPEILLAAAAPGAGRRRARSAVRSRLPIRLPALGGVTLAVALTLWSVLALNLNAYRADAWRALGHALGPEGAGDLPAAEDALRAAVRLAPWQPAYEVALAQVCGARAASSQPPNATALGDECRAGLVEAERHLRRAIALEPRDFQPYLTLGYLCGLRARFEPEYAARGVQAFRAAATATPRRQRVYWEWAEFYLGLGRRDDALERYRFALALDPGVAASHRRLAEAYVQFSLAGEAEREYETAWRLELQNIDPRYVTYPQIAPRRAGEHEKLADLFLRLGNKKRAALHLRAALAVDGENTRARELLARIASR
jgi:putative inorganic carbon (hco3(-)) transporter